MNWKPGDIAIVVGNVVSPDKNGMSCTVTSSEFIAQDNDGLNKSAVSISGIPGFHMAFTTVLRKPPYDGHEPCSWEDVVWCPAETVCQGLNQ